jgi:hypothetical protein
MTGALYSRESRLHCLFITGESWLPVYLAQESVFADQFWLTPRCIHHQWVSTQRWQIYRGVTTPGGELRESWLPSNKYTGESIKNMNNSTNIRRKPKYCLGMSYWTRKSCLEKMTTKNLVTPSLYNDCFTDLCRALIITPAFFLMYKKLYTVFCYVIILYCLWVLYCTYTTDLTDLPKPQRYGRTNSNISRPRIFPWCVHMCTCSWKNENTVLNRTLPVT